MAIRPRLSLRPKDALRRLAARRNPDAALRILAARRWALGSPSIHPRRRDRSQALAPGDVTLAETLAAAGYRTIAYTGNPNNSRLTATDQGFGEFHEIWEVHPELVP